MTGPLNSLAKMVVQLPRFPSPAQSRSRSRGKKLKRFDVNQTMLDLNVLRPHFVRGLAMASRSTMFSLLLHYSLSYRGGRVCRFRHRGKSCARNAREHQGGKTIFRGRDKILQGVLMMLRTGRA